MQLPHQLPTVTGWVLQDFEEESRQQKADATGEAVLTFDPVPTGQLWIVDRVVISTTSNRTVTAAFYDGDPGPRTIIDGTQVPAAPGFAPGDNASPYRLPQGKTLTVVVSGAAQGDLATVRVWFALMLKANS